MIRKIGHARILNSFLKSKLTEKYSNPLLFLTAEYNRPFIIISLASLESIEFCGQKIHPEASCSNFKRRGKHIR